MTKKILAAVTAFAIATTAVVSSAEAKAKPVLPYNPTYCILFLPFLCMPPVATPVKHKVHKTVVRKAVTKKPAKKA
jgi:hypothetical protein